MIRRLAIRFSRSSWVVAVSLAELYARASHRPIESEGVVVAADVLTPNHLESCLQRLPEAMSQPPEFDVLRADNSKDFLNNGGPSRT